MRDYVIVRFKCNRGALISGDRTVYCDGHQWNSTRPDCLGSASFFLHLILIQCCQCLQPLRFFLFPILAGRFRLDKGSPSPVGLKVAQVQNLCAVSTKHLSGGNPAPRLAFLINNQPAAAEIGKDGEILLTIDLREHHQGAQVR